MSEPILPRRQWPAGIQQASVSANDNALRAEAMERPCLGVANDASGTDVDGDVWLVGDTPAGAFAEFTENDIALYRDSSWYAWAPVDGIRLVVNGVRKVYVGESTDEWQDDTSGGIPEAPIDGTGYVRKDGAWAAESGGSGAVDSVNGKTGAVTLTEGDIVAGINAQTGTTYTAVLTDEVVTMDNASPNEITIPPNSSVAFPVGRSLEIWQKGAGQTTVAAGSGVTILYHADNTLKLKGQHSGCSLRKVATNTWRLIGDMEQA